MQKLCHVWLFFFLCGHPDGVGTNTTSLCFLLLFCFGLVFFLVWLGAGDSWTAQVCCFFWLRVKPMLVGHGWLPLLPSKQKSYNKKLSSKRIRYQSQERSGSILLKKRKKQRANGNGPGGFGHWLKWRYHPHFPFFEGCKDS